MNKNKSLFYKPFFIAPSANIFAERALRFEELAQEESSEWALYLRFLAALSRIQDELLQQNHFKLPENSEHGQLPKADGSYLPAQLPSMIQTLIQKGISKLSENRQAQTQHLLTLNPDELMQMAQALLTQQAQESDKIAYIWLIAAVQVIWTAWAMQLTDNDVAERDNREACPCCGADAVASVVLNGGDWHNLRYQHCAICNSRWNMLRAKCTFCGDQSSISHEKIETSQASALQGARAECCGKCGHYRKLFLQTEQQNADPIADDLASLALDILVGEKGITRGGENPFLMA